jgi:tetratricopeptide (TPR) repeat protein
MPHDTSLRFNLAWSKAMLADFEGALSLLDRATVDALAQAAMLEVQLLHQVERFDEAADAARRHIVHHSDHAGLLGVTSTLAMDIEDIPLARACAERAGDHPDALTTLGMLALGEDRNVEALALFERALGMHSTSARAFVGKGLAELVAGRSAEAARNIVEGATIFGDHVGSWIAAGWAHLLNKNQAEARAAFEKALQIDANFSESHGSLAVLDASEGNIESAKRGVTLALRLDAKSFSGALAQAIILSSAGERERAQALIERALHTPVDANGRTIAQSLARYAY